jgi:hypothetical protein
LRPVPDAQVPYTFALVDLDTMPATKTTYPLYRTPICLSVANG